MHPTDGRVDPHPPVDVTVGVRGALQRAQYAVPRAVQREPVMPLRQRLPRPELSRQVTPRHTRALAVDRALDQRSVRSHRLAHRSLHGREQRLDPSPHLITEHRRTRHARSINDQSGSGAETRPRRLGSSHDSDRALQVVDSGCRVRRCATAHAPAGPDAPKRNDNSEMAASCSSALRLRWPLASSSSLRTTSEAAKALPPITAGYACTAASGETRLCPGTTLSSWAGSGRRATPEAG
jgi:hypothetical protein